MNHVLYEKFSKLYEGFWYPIFIRSFKKVCGHVNKTSPKTLLEVGLGPGTTIPLYDNSIQYTGVDVSEQMVSLAQKKVEKLNLPNKTLQTISPGKLPFDENSFDAVISFSVVTVVPDYKDFFENLMRVTKPGGFIYIIGHFQNNDTSSFQKVIDKFGESLTQKFMGFTLKLKESDLNSIKGVELVESFYSTHIFSYPLNTCLIFKKN